MREQKLVKQKKPHSKDEKEGERTVILRKPIQLLMEREVSQPSELVLIQFLHRYDKLPLVEIN